MERVLNVELDRKVFFATHDISTYLSLSVYSPVKSMNGGGVTPLGKTESHNLEMVTMVKRRIGKMAADS